MVSAVKTFQNEHAVSKWDEKVVSFRSPKKCLALEVLTALIDHARFVDRSRLRGVTIGRLNPDALALLDRHLGRVLGLR